MIDRVMRGSAGMLAVVALSGCLGSAPMNGTGQAMRPSSFGNGLVLQAEQLWDRGGNLLSLIAGHVSSMRVQRSSQCPEIVIRGRKSVVGPNDPSVYIDGARAGNTCILEMLRPEDVERVEVYPTGVTPRPGYRSNSNGLILIFMRGAGDS